MNKRCRFLQADQKVIGGTLPIESIKKYGDPSYLNFFPYLHCFTTICAFMRPNQFPKLFKLLVVLDRR
jgi:hypothetical protein